jgi:hypothetical protein
MADQALLVFERATWSKTPLMNVADSALPKRLAISMASSKLTLAGMSGQKSSS